MYGQDGALTVELWDELMKGKFDLNIVGRNADHVALKGLHLALNSSVPQSSNYGANGC